MSTCRPFFSSRLSFSRITRIEQPALDGREWIYSPYIAYLYKKPGRFTMPILKLIDSLYDSHSS